MDSEPEGVRWAGSYRPRQVSDTELDEMEASDALFESARSKYSAKLRRARLARQVRIFGWSATDDLITKVKLLCREPEVDRPAVTALFGPIEVEWFAELPNGRIREVSGWDPAANCWVTVGDT